MRNHFPSACCCPVPVGAGGAAAPEQGLNRRSPCPRGTQALPGRSWGHGDNGAWGALGEHPKPWLLAQLPGGWRHDQEAPSPPSMRTGVLMAPSLHLICAPRSLELPIPRCPGGRGLNRSRDEAALTSPKLPRPPRRGRRSERNEAPGSSCPWEGERGRRRAVPISGSGRRERRAVSITSA